jgi:hypothetical protein
LDTLIDSWAGKLRLGPHCFLYLHTLVDSCVLWLIDHPSGTPLPLSALKAHVRRQIEEAPDRVGMLEAQIDTFMWLLYERLDERPFMALDMEATQPITGTETDSELAVRRCTIFLMAFVLEELKEKEIPIIDGRISTPRSNGPRSRIV